MTAWVTSDHHLWHETVGVTYRGFQYIDQHNDYLAWQWDKSGIKDGDDVYVLGDCALGENRFRAMGWYATRPGVKHLILGNHDRAHPCNSNAHRYLSDYRTGFTSVQLSLMLKHGGHKLLLSHFPIEGDHGEDRFTQWRLRDEGLPIIHGHTHSKFVRTVTSRGTVQLHAGVDAWDLAPVKLGDLVALLDLPKDED